VHEARALSIMPSGALPGGVTHLYVSRDSVVWVGTQHGFGRRQNGRFEFHELGAGGLAGYVTGFAEDAAYSVGMQARSSDSTRATGSPAIRLPACSSIAKEACG